MSTQTKVTEKKEAFDTLKALTVIEHDKDLNDIFRADKVRITYPVLKTMVISDSLDPSIKTRIEEIFTRLILQNQRLLKFYKKVKIDETDKPIVIPKWFGKKKIEDSIKNSNETTELDRAMLSLNNLKNLYSKLNSRLIKDKHQPNKILTTSDYREIIAIVRMAENKMKNILKKK